MTRRLTDKQKLELFELATEFRISDDISINSRSRRGDNIWAIMDITGSRYNRNHKWEHEPLPSSRDDEFIARTTYTLQDAFRIVDSQEFVKRYRI